MSCDYCADAAVWLVFAAYSVPYPDVAGGYVVHYPAPMARTCSDHLSARMIDDEKAPASTREFLVRPA